MITFERQASAQLPQHEPTSLTAQPKRRKLIRKSERGGIGTSNLLAQLPQQEPASFTAQPKRRKLIRRSERKAKIDRADVTAELPEQVETPFWESDSENQPEELKVTTAQPKRRKLIEKKTKAKVDSAEATTEPPDQDEAPLSADDLEDEAEFAIGLDEVNDDGDDSDDDDNEDDSHKDGPEARWVAVHPSLLPIGCPPDRYQISSLGEVKANTQVQGRVPQEEPAQGDGSSNVSVGRAVLISFEGMPEDPEMTVDHIDGNRKNDVLDNLQFLPWLENFRKGGDDKAAPKIHKDVDMTTAPAVDAQEWKQHPQLPHVECSRQGWLRETGSSELLPLQAGYYGHRHARVAGVVPWLSVHRAVYQTWVGEIPSGMIVHHVAGDRTDNAPGSLQLATPAENARWGRTSNANNTSQAYGVCWHKKAHFVNVNAVNSVGNPDRVPDADPTTSVKKKHNLPKYIYEMGGGRLHVSLHWQKKNYTIGTCYDVQEALVMRDRAIQEYDFVPGVRMGRLDELERMNKARQAHRHRRAEQSQLSGVVFQPAHLRYCKKTGYYKQHKAVWKVRVPAPVNKYVGRRDTPAEAEQLMRDSCAEWGVPV
ncbi:hypothetical protein HDU87_007812 [Geranomyces variabilis]|uniref:HNH nuclease domain-containing protein n=1 Tax=Geranomyces variabilis TaxID=109894 RepID=A0AAD5TG27_9FUNG|nr:hypothetical protein HDU87_007812 [Geranomyces variabilis]